MIDDLIDAYSLICPNRPVTVRHFKDCGRDFEKWLGRSATPADWTRDTLNRYLRDRERLSPFTLHIRRNAMLVLWRLGHMSKLIAEAPPTRKSGDDGNEQGSADNG